MKQTQLIMGMPITVEVVGAGHEQDVQAVFDYFNVVDARYSTYKPDSEISQINRGLPEAQWSSEMKRVLRLCDQTKQQTHGYFDIKNGDRLDPSGLVKGWAIHNAATLLTRRGVQHFYIEAGGDIQVRGQSPERASWRVGIRNPFNQQEIVKVVGLDGMAIATSGTYVRGHHIYNPRETYRPVTEIASLSIIGPNIYEADRFATAAFAMGRSGIAFIETQPGLEGYMIDMDKVATYTSGFERYVINA